MVKIIISDSRDGALDSGEEYVVCCHGSIRTFVFYGAAEGHGGYYYYTSTHSVQGP